MKILGVPILLTIATVAAVNQQSYLHYYEPKSIDVDPDDAPQRKSNVNVRSTNQFKDSVREFLDQYANQPVSQVEPIRNHDNIDSYLPNRNTQYSNQNNNNFNLGHQASNHDLVGLTPPPLGNNAPDYYAEKRSVALENARKSTNTFVVTPSPYSNNAQNYYVKQEDQVSAFPREGINNAQSYNANRRPTVLNQPQGAKQQDQASAFSGEGSNNAQNYYANRRPVVLNQLQGPKQQNQVSAFPGEGINNVQNYYANRRPIVLNQAQVISTQAPLRSDVQAYDVNKSPVDVVNPVGTATRFGVVEKNDTLNVIFKNMDSDLSLALSAFSLNLMRAIEDRSTNVVISPYSIATVLALLQLGAVGDTQSEITRALQLSPETIAKTFKRLTDNVQKRNKGRNILDIATNLFVSDSFNLNQDYQNIAVSNFNSDVTPISFARGGINPVTYINNWVTARTHNKIQQLVTPEIITPATELVLANAVYFKGLWENNFNPESTQPDIFNLSNGLKKTVPFMRIRHGYKAGYDQDIDAQIAILPFELDQFSFMIILPSEKTNCLKVLSTLTNVKLANYHQIPKQEVLLVLPKFSIKADTDLTPIMKKMGINLVFSDLSDLSTIGTSRSHPPQVSSAVHTAVLSIDEKGSVAAAATAFAAVALSSDDGAIVLVANRPFLAVIWDNKASLPLFIAKVEDPSLS